VIDCLQGEGQRVILIGVEDKPIKGSRDRYSVALAWIRRAVWQENILLDDGRWVVLPEEVRSKPTSQTMKNCEFVLK
jgi:hypothetical protein